MQSGNQNQKSDQIKEKNRIENKKNNSVLKLQLKEISSQIEQVLYLQESKKNEVNVEDSSTKIDIQNYTHFTSEIERYKKSIESMKKEISQRMMVDKKEIEEMLKNELNIGNLLQNEDKAKNLDNKDKNEN